MIATLLTAAGAAQQKPATDLGNSAFEGYIELLRQQASIPGAVRGADSGSRHRLGARARVCQSRVANCRALGYPVRDRRPDRSFTSVLLLQCAEQRRLDLNERRARLRHQPPRAGRDGSPGAQPHVAGNLQVRRRAVRPAHAGRRRMRAAAVPEDRRPADDRSAGDGRLRSRTRCRPAPAQCPARCSTPTHLEHYGRVLANLAVPYKVDKRGHATRTELPSEGINAATGLVASARDLANSIWRSTTAFCCARIRCRRPGRPR